MKYREKGLNDVCLDGAERLVSDDDEDLLLFFQVDEVTKPGFFGKSAEKKKEKEMCFFFPVLSLCCLILYMESVCLPSSSFEPSVCLCIYPSLPAAQGKWRGASGGYLAD